MESPELRCGACIVGGGLAGILLALRLSRDPGLTRKGILLVEEAPSLGGRLASGHCGFEILPPEAQETLERHLLGQLDEAEQVEWEKARSTFALAGEELPQSYVVRREFASAAQVLSGPTELFTRREAERLQQLLSSGGESEAEGGGDAPVQKKPTPFGESEHWKGLAKAEQEGLRALYETVMGDGFAKAPVEDLRAALGAYLFRPHVARALRRSLLPLAARLDEVLLRILEGRGVRVLLGTELTRLTLDAQAGHLLELPRGGPDAPARVRAHTLTLALPVAQMIRFLDRDALRPSHARCLTRHPPRSMVVCRYELGDESALNARALPECLTLLRPLNRFLLPVERVRGLVTTDGGLLVVAELDYEQSLQAPAVREAVGRLRRAASRFFMPELFKDLKKSPLGMGPNALVERVSLVPVGLPFAPWNAPEEARDVSMAVGRLYTCGDGFRFAREPWRNVVATVQEACGKITKDLAAPAGRSGASRHAVETPTEA